MAMEGKRAGRQHDARINRFLYGGDYSPEQWPEDTWARDLELFSNCNINTLTVGVFAWARLQPAADRFDFGWLDRFLDLAADRGFSIVLATPTAAQPAWMSLQYPRCAPRRRVWPPQDTRHEAQFLPEQRKLQTFLAGDCLTHGPPVWDEG